MKIRFYLALAAAALVMTNCSQDEELVQVKQNAKGFTATIEGASRSDAAVDGTFSWTAGDKISVYTENGFDTYVNSEADVNTFTFAPEVDEEAGTPTGYAIYPAGNHAISGSDVTINLPATYTYGSTNAPMLATIEEGSSTLAFTHLAGVMRFVVKNVPVGASSFVFTTTNNIITGEHHVVNGQIRQNSEGTLGNNNSVTITFDALEEEAESMVFFVPLPVGTYGDYTVAIKGTNVDLSHPSTGVTNTIGRRTLLLMPEFACTDEGLGKASVAVIPVNGGDVSLSGIQSVTIGTATQTDELTINYTPSEGNATLNINDDSNATTSQDSKGKIVIKPEGETPVASLNLNTPSLTAELGAGTYSTVEALTAQQTLIIGEGVTVSNLVVKGGNVIVHGTLSAISRTDDNADEVTYVIYEEEDQIPETTLGENIVAVSAAEYDLIVAFSNGGTVTLDADVTLHKSLILSDDVTLNLDLNNKTLTGTFREACIKSSGNLTISNGNITNVGCAVLTEGGTLKMTDCYVTVTGSYWENAVEIRGGTTAEITGGRYTATGTLDAGQNTDWYGIGIVDGTVTLNTTVDGNFNGGVTLAPEGTRPNVTITGGLYSGKLYHGLNMNGGDLTLVEDAEMTFSGKGGDIRVYTKTGKINGVVFGFTLEGKKNYTLEELMAVIAEKKASAE